jgi:LacI family transcriptional regulator
MITARDVARELGVAVSTVGRAMADDPRISEDTKARVRRAADRLGYVGNNPARIMRGGSSNLIGLMIPDVANDFYAAIAQSLSDCLDRHGHRLVLSLTQDDREIEARHIRELVGARAAGIILVPTARPKRESQHLLESLPHAQLLRHNRSFGKIWFGINDEQAIHQATAHLIERGHRHIAYVGGHLRLSTGASRVQGYRKALEEAAIVLDPALEMLGEPTNAVGLEAAARLLARADPPTAILTGSVHITMGVIQHIEQRRLAIPDDLSVIGFGESPWFEWWRGGLTTVHPPVHDLATTCGLWFLDNLESKRNGRALPTHSAITNSTLVLRSSVGPPGRYIPRA